MRKDPGIETAAEGAALHVDETVIEVDRAPLDLLGAIAEGGGPSHIDKADLDDVFLVESATVEVQTLEDRAAGETRQQRSRVNIVEGPKVKAAAALQTRRTEDRRVCPSVSRNIDVGLGGVVARREDERGREASAAVRRDRRSQRLVGKPDAAVLLRGRHRRANVDEPRVREGVRVLRPLGAGRTWSALGTAEQGAVDVDDEPLRGAENPEFGQVLRSLSLGRGAAPELSLIHI